MAKTIRWLKDPTVEEVSAVDLAANRKHFRLFKRGGTMKKGAGGHARVAKGDPDDFEPEWSAEGGVTLYPWQQAVADMSTAFSTDDGPRIAALLLAKYGEGPNAEIRLPSGIDPMEAATLAIEEAKNLMKDNPLLMPEAKGTKATKSAVREVLAEFFGKKKAVAVNKCGTATADADLAAELKALNAHLAALNTAPADKATATATKPKGKPAPVVVEEDEEENPETIGDGDDDGDDEGDEEEEVENANEDFAKAVKEDIGALVGAVKELAQRMNAMESTVAKRSRGVSKAQHSGEAAGDKSGKPTTYYSSILGADMPMEKVEPFLKRSAGKAGDAAVKH